MLRNHLKQPILSPFWRQKMKKYKAGSFYFDKEENYYTDDFETFYKENDKVLNNDDLEQ